MTEKESEREFERESKCAKERESVRESESRMTFARMTFGLWS